jgi:hypothetical protein
MCKARETSTVDREGVVGAAEVGGRDGRAVLLADAAGRTYLSLITAAVAAITVSKTTVALN